MPNPSPSTDALYRVYRHPGSDNQVAAFLVESSAQQNVDVADPQDLPADSQVVLDILEPQPDKDAASNIARTIRDMKSGGESPEVVFFIHGFNNPRFRVLQRMEQMFQALNDDSAIRERTGGVVNIVYRWPSEPLRFSTLGSSLRAAMGTILVALLAFAVVYIIGLVGYFAPDTMVRVVNWTFLILLMATLIWAFLQTWGKAFLAGIILLATLVPLGLRPLSQPPSRDVFNLILTAIYYILFLVLFSIPFVVFIERGLVYFRDTYRAINYGVPDLASLLRELDTELVRNNNGNPLADTDRIQLSFIGHSLGALVVTNLIRFLADAFPGDAKDAPEVANSKNAVRQHTHASPYIGKAFSLSRLVLVSPDIPAETLMTGRANFLLSSLSRFKEVYLFSNEGDEVLRLISTLANYFSFPNINREFGFRLGNVEVLDGGEGTSRRQYGVRNRQRLFELRQALDNKPDAVRRLLYLEETFAFLNQLRLGSRPLLQLLAAVENPGNDAKQVNRRAEEAVIQALATLERTEDLEECPAASTAPAASLLHALCSKYPHAADLPFPVRFTYFDCTDYRDRNLAKSRADSRESREERRVGMVTRAKRKAKLGVVDHWGLLLQYLFASESRRVDVHSGYFDGPYVCGLIYRLCCLGWETTLRAEDEGAQAATREEGLNALSDNCDKHQIQVLLSPARYLTEEIAEPPQQD